jgi:hypothetical protein
MPGHPGHSRDGRLVAQSHGRMPTASPMGPVEIDLPTLWIRPQAKGRPQRTTTPSLFSYQRPVPKLKPMLGPPP